MTYVPSTGGKKLITKKKINHIIDFLLATFCISGALLQVYQATTEYMSYSTVTIVERQFLHNEPMPAVGLCATYNYAEFANHTVIERMLELPRFKDILNHCSVLDASTLEMTDCMSTTRINEYMDSRFKCYSMFEERSLRNGSHLRYAPAMSQNVENLLDVKFKAWGAGAGPPGLLVIYPNYELFTMKRGSHNKVWLSQAGSFELTFAFQIERHTLLPAPFSSKCVDPARRAKLKTRAVALDKCILDHFSLKGRHYLPFQIYASPHDSIKRLSVKSIDAERERSIIQTALTECDKLLGEEDCFSETMKIIRTSTRMASHNKSTLRVQLAGIPLYALKSEMKPSIPLLDYLNWVGSICNIWFAFTMSGASFIAMTGVGFCLKEIYGNNMKRKKRRAPFSGFLSGPCHTKRKHRKLIRSLNVIVFILSLLLAIFQITDILEIHFGTPFKWNYYTQMGDQIWFPAAIFCVDRVVNKTKVMQMFPELYKQLKDSTLDWDSYLTVDQQEDVTLTAKELFDQKMSKFTPRETMKWGRIDQVFKYYKYINYHKVCLKTFSTDVRLNKSVELRPYKRTIMEQMQFFHFYIKIPDREQFSQIAVLVQIDRLFSRDGYLKLMRGNPNNIMLHVSRNLTLQVNRIIMHHREIAQYYFPGHHKSECLPYRALFGGKGREKLMDVCVKDLVMKSLRNDSNGVNYWPRELFFSKRMNTMDVPRLLREPLLFSKDDKPMRKYEKYCDKKLAWKDCEFRTLELESEAEYVEWKEQDEGLITFILYPPGKGYIEMRQEVRFSLLNLFGFCGGTIGFWIGISMLDVKQILNFMRKIRIKNRKLKIV